MNSLIVPTISMLSLFFGPIICAQQPNQLLADEGRFDRLRESREREYAADVGAVRLVQLQEEPFYSEWDTDDWVRALKSDEPQSYVTGPEFIDTAISVLMRSTPEQRRKIFDAIRKEWIFDKEAPGEIRRKQLRRFLDLFSILEVKEADYTLTQVVGWWVTLRPCALGPRHCRCLVVVRWHLFWPYHAARRSLANSDTAFRLWHGPSPFCEGTSSCC